MDKLHNAFRIPVYESKLELDNEEIKLFCKEYQQDHETIIKSNTGGYQSENLILKSPVDGGLMAPSVLHSLINEIEWSMREIGTSPILVSDIWFNINKYKDYNMEHYHPGSLYSGVYYVKTPENCGSLHFLHPAADILNHYPDDRKESCGKNIYDSTWFNRYAVSPEENLLYVFPSWLKHYVTPNLNSNEERISISYNSSYLTESV